MSNINRSNLQKLRSLARRYAPRDLYDKIREKLAAPCQDYPQIWQSFQPGEEELQRQREARFSYAPLMSIVVPAYETDELFLRQMIDSVIAQTYPNWELCVADGSPGDQVGQTIARHYAGEPRVKYKKLERNEGISGNTNQGFAMAEGEYIGLLDHDDLLAPSALYEMVKRICDTGADMLYSDEDKVSADLKQHMEPHFKLDFNRELLLGNNYICHFLVVSRGVLEAAGGLDGNYNGAQDFDFALRCSETAKRIEHIPKILYHWRMHSGSTAGNTDSKPYAYEAGKRAVEAALARNGQRGTVAMTQELGFYRTVYELPQGVTLGVCCWQETPSGSRGKKTARALAPCAQEARICRTVEKWKRRITQELYGSQVKILWDYDVLNASSKVDFVLFLNASAKSFLPGSIRRLLGSCARPGIGLAGSKVIAGGRVLQCGFWNRRLAGSYWEGRGREPACAVSENGNHQPAGSYWEGRGRELASDGLEAGNHRPAGSDQKDRARWSPRFQDLPRRFKGYFRRAYLPVEVDAVSPDLAVLSREALKKTGMLSGGDGRNTAARQHPGACSLPAGAELAGFWLDVCGSLWESGCKIIVDPASETVL